MLYSHWKKIAEEDLDKHIGKFVFTKSKRNDGYMSSYGYLNKDDKGQYYTDETYILDKQIRKEKDVLILLDREDVYEADESDFVAYAI